MRKMTEENLKAAFAGESQAHMRYLIFSKKAEEEGKPNIARLFKAISFAEQVHATNHYRVLGMVKDTPANLEEAMGGENYEVEEMYPAFDAVAKLQDEKDAQRSIGYALEAEKIHEKMYADAKKVAEAGKDIEIGDVYICPVCGYTAEGSAPDRCPVCGTPKEKFAKF